MTQATPAPRGEGVASPVELVVDRLSAEVKPAEDESATSLPTGVR